MDSVKIANMLLVCVVTTEKQGGGVCACQALLPLSHPNVRPLLVLMGCGNV